MSTQMAGSQPASGIGSAGPNGTAVLECVNLTKAFSGTTVVDSLSFTMASGEVLGFLGPNGAGKSTTVGMILNLIRPTRGDVLIAGQRLADKSSLVSNHVGAIIENPAFYPYLTGRDNLRAFAMMTGKVDEGQIESLLKLVNMHDRADKAYKTFSLGMKQRLGIAATLLSNPSIVILDEPTNGLDPAGQREIREVIPRLANEGHAVLLASHLLNEVEQVCHRIAIIRRGKLIREGRVDDLLRGGGFVEVIVSSGEMAEAASVLGALPFVQRTETEGNALRIIAPEDSGQAINRALVERGIFAFEIAAKRHSLEDLFIGLTEDDQPNPVA